MKKTALVFLCTAVPNERWLERIVQMVDPFGYDKIVVTDLEAEMLPPSLDRFKPHIRFKQTHKVYVAAGGYWDLGFADRHNLKMMATANPCAWEKALFFHFHENWSEKYKHVWIIEDDVMIPRKDTISFLDWKYPHADLLCANHISDSEDPRWVWWPHCMAPRPWYHSMVCAVRLSSALADLVHVFAQRHRKLFYSEMIFNILAHQNGLKIQTPSEMKKIVFRNTWKDEDVGDYELVHPMKNFEQQERIWARKND